MTTNRFFLFYGVLNLLLFIPIYGQNVKHPPVSPDASCEATALLDFLYEISGKYTLTGQHSYPRMVIQTHIWPDQTLLKKLLSFTAWE
jgi:hypothetical protein